MYYNSLFYLQPSANLSSGSTSKTADTAEQDPEVEIDIFYSQYLHAKIMEKMMTDRKSEVESSIKVMKYIRFFCSCYNFFVHTYSLSLLLSWIQMQCFRIQKWWQSKIIQRR